MSSLALLDPPVSPPRPPARPSPRLRIAPYDFTAAATLERELSIGHTLAQVLVRRGLGDPSAARAFLRADQSHPPQAFAGMLDAVSVIERHVAARTLITVHGDYDVDGVCATAILVRALRRRGANVDWFLPDRRQDGYGLTLQTVQRLAARGTRLLLTVDCAITAVEEVAAARAGGLEVVVTDHHAVRGDGALPDAPLVHPALGGYPCPDLCAAGVASKLAEALGVAPAQDLDLVALATVADLVPLRGENRRLVCEGLRVLSTTAKPGLRALMRVARVDPGSLDAGTVGYRLAPRINAAGRLRRADAGLELVLTDDDERAERIATELDAVNAERRDIERRIAWEAEALVVEHGERAAYVLAAEGWHPGVIGIVASRIAERFCRPTVLVALDGDMGTGSGRGIPGFDLLAGLHAAAPTLERYGGHRAAAGLTIARERVGELRDVLERHAAQTLAPEHLVRHERVDAVLCGEAPDLSLAEELEQLEPCGMGNPGVNLLIAGARLDDPRPMGEEGRHLRLSVRAGEMLSRAVCFGCDGRLPLAAAQPADATFRLKRNEWNGTVEPQLVLRHAQPCAPRPIEVLGEPPRYLPAVLAELERTIGITSAPATAAPLVSDRGTDAPGRAVLDRRPCPPGALLADLVAGGQAVLAVCADVARRRTGLAERFGGFALCAWAALERDPTLAAPYVHLVALDAPMHPDQAALLATAPGDGHTHLAWGEAELAFSKQIHELEFGLRASLAVLYRALRARGVAAGEELEALLRGDGAHPRSAQLAGRLVRVLEELGLVSLDRDLPALALGPVERTELRRSAAYRAYEQRYEDGRRYLSTKRPAGPG